MTLTEQIITIGIAVLGVQFTRWLPFWIFPANRPIPEYIRYLGKVLPAALFGVLVVYCYKNVVALHLWKRNMFLSIAAGTMLYMFLVQQVFV